MSGCGERHKKIPHAYFERLLELAPFYMVYLIDPA